MLNNLPELSEPKFNYTNMKYIAVKSPKDSILHKAVCDKFVSLGYKLFRPEHDKLPGIGYPVLHLFSGKIEGAYDKKPNHTLEEFFALTSEDVQDYRPKEHRVTAKSIKEANGWDQRDKIVLED